MSKQVDIREINYNGSLFFPQTHEQAVVGLPALLEAKANKDGFYESMGVGTAVNLAGQIERTNDSLYRTSGGSEDIATGTASIENIKGNTVAWNQMSPLMSSPMWSFEYCTNVISSDGRQVDITFTSEINQRFRLVQKVIANHKYFVQCYTKIGSGCPTISWAVSGIMSPKIIQSVSVDEFNKIAYIKTARETQDNSVLYPPAQNFSGATYSVKDFIAIDLTLIYGEGNEPTTPEQFEADYQKWFGKPLTYEPYNEGELIPVKMTGLKTTGFNQWDEEWEVGGIDGATGENSQDSTKIRSKNYIPIVTDATYYCFINRMDLSASLPIRFYDANKNYIGNRNRENSYIYPNMIFLPPENTKYARFASPVGYGTTYNNDICINISWSGTKDGTYEPYEEHTLPFDVTTAQGKLNGEGELVTPFADGLKKAGSVQDEIYYVGNKVYGVKRVGSVDLGSTDWSYSDGTNCFYTLIADIKRKVSGDNNTILSSKRIAENPSTTLASIGEKNIRQVGTSVGVKDSNYATVSAFTTVVTGEKLYYELETPLVYELENVELPARFKVNDWGTEEQLHADGVLSAPATLGVLYGVNAVDQLRNLPKNYVTMGNNNTESTMKKFLTALGAAMGGTWTITVDDNDATDFNFVFTPNATPEEDIPEEEDVNALTNEGE